MWLGSRNTAHHVDVEHEERAKFGLYPVVEAVLQMHHVSVLSSKIWTDCLLLFP